MKQMKQRPELWCFWGGVLFMAGGILRTLGDLLERLEHPRTFVFVVTAISMAAQVLLVLLLLRIWCLWKRHQQRVGKRTQIGDP